MNRMKYFQIRLYELDISEQKYDYFIDNVILSINGDIRKKIKIYNHQQIDENLRLFYIAYSIESAGVDISWYMMWKTFFNLDTHLRRNAVTGHGLIVIGIYGSYYCITFGRSYSLIDEYVKYGFGLDLASKLFDGHAIHTKSSKYFSTIKNKSILTYIEPSQIDNDETAAVVLFEANIVEDPRRKTQGKELLIEKLLLNIKPKVETGISSINFTLKGKEITLDLLIETIALINEIYKIYECQYTFPRMIPVSKPVSKKLDEILLKSIRESSNQYLSFSLPYYGLDSTDKYIFHNNIESYALRYKRSKSEFKEEIDVSDIREFIKKNDDIATIRDIMLKTISSGEQNDSELIKWLDVHLNFENKDYILFNGKWHYFNQSYLENLNNRITEISNTCLEINDNYSFTNLDVEKIRIQEKDNLKKLFSSSGDTETKNINREFIYNYSLCLSNKWHLFDRVFFKRNIEICDIYIENKSLIHVKIGDTNELQALIRQSLYNTKIYFIDYDHNFPLINRMGTSLPDKNNIEEIKILFLRQDKSIDNYNLKNIQSIMCKILLIDWHSFVTDHNKRPKIIVAKFLTNKPRKKY